MREQCCQIENNGNVFRSFRVKFRPTPQRLCNNPAACLCLAPAHPVSRRTKLNCLLQCWVPLADFKVCIPSVDVGAIRKDGIWLAASRRSIDVKFLFSQKKYALLRRRISVVWLNSILEKNTQTTGRIE